MVNKEMTKKKIMIVSHDESGKGMNRARKVDSTLAKKGFDPMIVLNINDALVERHGNYVGFPLRNGVLVRDISDAEQYPQIKTDRVVRGQYITRLLMSKPTAIINFLKPSDYNGIK